MTGKKPKDELGAVLGNLRRERSVEVEPEKIEVKKIVPIAPKIREPREAFTSRLRPSQRRWLKRWASDLEEETGIRVTVEDILENLLLEVQENEILRQKFIERIIESK